MLVLTRRKDQAIGIGPSTVRVLKVKGKVVSLGIEAPAALPIVRTELNDPPPPPPQTELWLRDQAPAQLAKLFTAGDVGNFVALVPAGGDGESMLRSLQPATTAIATTGGGSVLLLAMAYHRGA